MNRVISGLRFRYGLTWKELADLVHATLGELEEWINGAPVPDNIRIHIDRIALLLNRCDQGTSAVNRRELFHFEGEGTVYDLLRGGKFVEAESRLKAGVIRPSRTPLDSEGRRTLHPVILLGGDLEQE